MRKRSQFFRNAASFVGFIVYFCCAIRLAHAFRTVLAKWIDYIHNLLIVTYKVAKIYHPAKFVKHLFY